MEERSGEAFELGEQLTVVGRKLPIGAAAPAFPVHRILQVILDQNSDRRVCV